MQTIPCACAHAPDAADLEPGSHVVYHDRTDGGCLEAAGLAAASRITRHGGLIIELGRRPRDPDQALHIAAILTVAQAVGMLFEQALEEVGGASPPPALLSRPIAGIDPDHDPVAAWIGGKEEEARGRGVPRLASLLASAGIRGDVDLAADQLWTACGY
jgi:hypothetical protein